jgi:amino acid transporter
VAEMAIRNSILYFVYITAITAADVTIIIIIIIIIITIINLAAYRHMNLSKRTLQSILNASTFSNSRKATLDAAVFRVGGCPTDRAVTLE